MAATAFDLAERLQTPVIVMSDLDLGMNDHLSPPLSWDDNRRYDRGKVLDAAALDARSEQWGRYLDSDGDGICYRTYPGTHPTQGRHISPAAPRITSTLPIPKTTSSTAGAWSAGWHINGKQPRR